MQDIPSHLEARLAQLIAATPPLPAASRCVGRWQLDLVYLSQDDRQRLDACLR